jgi:NYN domain-containing protein
VSAWMCFVDGENFTIRGQQYAKRVGLDLTGHPELYVPDTFLWIPGGRDTIEIAGRAAGGNLIGGPPLRAYYYTSVVGDDPKLLSVRRALRALSFDPQVFKKDAQNQRSKGVDITLTKDMLSHACLGNYSQAVLVAGDGDYVPLVQEVKRMGKNVFLAFFGGPDDGLNEELRLAADQFYAIEGWFRDLWAGKVSVK